MERLWRVHKKTSRWNERVPIIKRWSETLNIIQWILTKKFRIKAELIMQRLCLQAVMQVWITVSWGRFVSHQKFPPNERFLSGSWQTRTLPEEKTNGIHVRMVKAFNFTALMHNGSTSYLKSLRSRDTLRDKNNRWVACCQNKSKIGQDLEVDRKVMSSYPNLRLIWPLNFFPRP